MKKGRPTKVTAEIRKQVYAYLEAGASLADAADLLGIHVRNLHRAKKRSRVFATGVKKAAKTGKIRLLKKVGSAKAWQAAAWMLERKWGSEFGRREQHKVEHTGPNGGPVKTETDVKHVIDYDQLREDLERLASNRRVAGRVPENGDGKPVHSGDAD